MKNLLQTLLIPLLICVHSTSAMAIDVASTNKPVAIKHVFEVYGLSCPFCVTGIKKTFMKMEDVQSVVFSLKKATVTVYTNKEICFSEKKLKTIFAKAAFSYRGTLKKPKNCK